MTTVQEIEANTYPGKCNQEASSRTFLDQLQPIGRALLSLPGLRLLQPAARRAWAVAEPVGRITYSPLPQLPVGAGGDLTVLSANLWHDWPRRRHLASRLEGFAGLVEAANADLVLLQEVSRTPEFWVDRWLAKRLGMAHVYARANGHLAGIGFEEGLAILSRYPLGEPQLRQLSGGGRTFVRRLALSAPLATPDGEVLAISAHLGLWHGRNAAQFTCLEKWVEGLNQGRLALIGGDFNAHETAPQVARAQTSWLDTFRALHPQADGTTHELRWPWGKPLRRARLDYIFLSPGHQPWQVLESRTLHQSANNSARRGARAHSDHHAVLARLAPV